MTEYALIETRHYYAGDCQHPSGYSRAIAEIGTPDGPQYCIGTLAGCRDWEQALTAGPQQLVHGVSGIRYDVVEITGTCTYDDFCQSVVDWDACPIHQDPEDDYLWLDMRLRDANTYWVADPVDGITGYIVSVVQD